MCQREGKLADLAIRREREEERAGALQDHRPRPQRSEGIVRSPLWR